VLNDDLVAASSRQRGGVTLFFTGVMLLMTAGGAAAALHFMLSSRQALSHRLDHEIAFRAAEVALLDAESDMLRAAQGGQQSERLDRWPIPGRCGEGPQRGLCVPALGVAPIWQPWLDRTKAADAIGIALGAFSSATLPGLPGNVAGSTTLPRYVVELLPERAAGERIGSNGVGDGMGPGPRLRITALGQGRDPAVRVVLQTVLQL
jgi:Tfp pilus assembly protein PilX